MTEDAPTREQVQEALDDATALLASDTYTMGLAIRHATKVLVRAARLWLEGPQVTENMIERAAKAIDKDGWEIFGEGCDRGIRMRESHDLAERVLRAALEVPDD